MDTSTLRDNLSDTINRVAYGGERIKLRRRGKDVAAIVSIEDLAILEVLEDRADVKEARKRLAKGGKPVPLAEVKRRLGL
jgi:prevent-host-death family protein